MTAADRFINDAIAEARMAYEFAPNSYSFSAFSAVLRIKQEYEDKPDWIAEVGSWNARESA